MQRHLTKIVKSIVNRGEETKMCSNQYGLTSFNSGITTPGDFIAVMPQIIEGIGQNQRIGSSIKPIKLVIRGYVAYATDGIPSARMIGGRLFCFSDKTVANYNVAASAGNNFQLLDVGGNSQAFTGAQLNYCMPHNTDGYKWYADKKMKFLKPFGYTDTLAPTSTVEITSMNTTLFHPFTITIPAGKMPSQLKYDASISINNPMNFAPYLALGYTNLSGFTADVAVTQLKMEFVATLYYKDA